MRLIDADELMKRIRKEEDLIDLLFDDKPKLGWQRRNELVRIKCMIAKMPTHEKKGLFGR